MRFEELTTQNQEFLMYCLSDHIKWEIKKEAIDEIIFPSYEEYKQAQSQAPLLGYHK